MERFKGYNLLMESDSKMVVSWFNRELQVECWTNQFVINDINNNLELLREYSVVHLEHINREANNLADNLTKISAFGSCAFVVWY